MIQPPQRSVTRFLVPLVDVLLLMFGIFLLMPMFNTSTMGSPDLEQKLVAQAKKIQSLVDKLENSDNQQLIEKLREQITRLQSEIQSLDKGTSLYLQRVGVRDDGEVLVFPNNIELRVFNKKGEIIEKARDRLTEDIIPKFKNDAGSGRTLALLFAPYRFRSAGMVTKYEELFQGIVHNLKSESELPVPIR